MAKFKFSKRLLSCKNNGVFPDLAIRLNKDRSVFTGGELIELKDSKSYAVSSFNSTIPTGRKNIHKIISSEYGTTFLQMKMAGDDVFSLEVRDVYYLVRGRRGVAQKICLVHGSFFETISESELISQSFGQVLDEKLADTKITKEDKNILALVFSEQGDFSRVRNVDKASVKLRFRIMTEVKPEGNILNPKHYPEIADNSLNFVTPYHSETEREDILLRMDTAFGEDVTKKFKFFSLKHPLNGWFVVFQVDL
ncbi:MAG TPA: hypothetical protein VMN99_07155 [Anaerolineales bacterium]|nr:hypothetical protein [Anaerolineales bacterium]